MIRNTTPRGGFTLIEMATTIAVGSVMMGIAVSVLYLLLAIQRQSREALGRRAALGQLAEQFRDDVHAATDFGLVAPTPGGEKTSVVWELRAGARRVIQYSRPRSDVYRAERVEGNLVRQESFALARHVEVAIAFSGDPGPPVVSLSIVPEDHPAEASRARPMRVDAVLGRDHRFLKSQEP